MQEEITNQIIAYILHDAVQNVEGYITNYDKNLLQEAESSGCIIIAERNDGSRQIVKAEDVHEPAPNINGVKLVKHSYVDNRMKAVCEVFDALAETMPSTKSRDASEGQTAFAEALAALKAIVYGEEF